MSVDPESRQSGFTLIEMTIVLAIAAIVFSVGALSLSALKGRMTPLRLSHEIAQLIASTHARAQHSQIPQSVVIDLDAKTVFVRNESRKIFIPDEYAVSVVVGRETVADEKALEIHFLPDGTSSGAEISISRPGDGNARIDVNWLTGLARVSDANI